MARRAEGLKLMLEQQTLTGNLKVSAIPPEATHHHTLQALSLVEIDRSIECPRICVEGNTKATIEAQ